jgi:hypothetical protein
MGVNVPEDCEVVMLLGGHGRQGIQAEEDIL